MKTTIILRSVILLMLMITASLLWAQKPDNPCIDQGDEFYSGVEINDVLCGYAIERQCLVEENDKQILFESNDITVKLSVLGAGVDIKMNFFYKVDPDTWRWFYNKMEIDNGGAYIHNRTEITGDTAYFFAGDNMEPEKTPISPDIQLESNLRYPHLVRDFIEGDADEEIYRVFDIMSGKSLKRNTGKLASRISF